MEREFEEKIVISEETNVTEQVKIEEPKECPVTEEEVSSEDDNKEVVEEEPSTEAKVSSLQAAIAAMKTTTMKTDVKANGSAPPKPFKKKPAAPTKRGSASKAGGSGIKKRNTPRKAPAPRPGKNSGKGSSTNSRAIPGKGARGKGTRGPPRGERSTKSKSPVRRSGKGSEKKSSKGKQKKTRAPKEDEKTVLRLRFVIGENGVINGGADQ